MPSSAFDRRAAEAEGEPHDFCLATRFCRRCGASALAIAEGRRARTCEPGVVGISWIRAVERMRVLMEPPLVRFGLDYDPGPGPGAAA